MKLTTFYPIAEHSYGIKEGVPEECVNTVFATDKALYKWRP